MAHWTLLNNDFRIVLFIVYFCLVKAFFEKEAKRGDLCFCQLKGQVGDCSCSVGTVDHFNNVKVYPRLASLITKEYFRFYKVNLKKDCPFWSDNSRCAMRYCSVEHCLDDAPPLIKSYSSRKNQVEDMSVKYLEPYAQGECDSDLNAELGYLNTTISAATMEEFARWEAFDDALDLYCFYEEDPDAEYVDLLLNPERYTGYRGYSAHRIWNSIYMENCFRPKHSFDAYIKSSKLNNMCLEKRVFYRVISGIHSSINIHLSAKYLLSDIGVINGGGRWGPNLVEFERRFSPETTNGEGPEWIRNLYFVYLLEMRALAKAAPYLEQEEYFTGRHEDDSDTKDAVVNLLQVIKSFSEHFNESTMFSGGAQATKLKEEFGLHFRNITAIMDCVGCDKCKLWGKLQIQGLGTALKILFSGRFDQPSPSPYSVANLGKNQFQLDRNEIIALFNAFARLSTSIYELEKFRQIMR
ncbi:ero1-like protein [Macrosteles quadrilineatus]|uniref:ero1-like protein n=1 Tax=Macrosteles quadrilineatus TaxID=74068 RepID=UPI0023E12631|nr:ero1-like protein isoform X2 [Macrosteles quadrilineatus]XP_054270631.1 ero1-like protein [Macrosteles quadrilineatus]